MAMGFEKFPTPEEASKDIEKEESSEFLEVEEIIREITLENLEGREKKPRVSVSDFGANGLANLKEKIKTQENNDDAGIVAVVRCWNKSEKDLEDFLHRVEKLKSHIPNLKGVFLSINSDGEKGKPGLTEDNLTRAIASFSADIPVVPIEISGYTWTSGLNAPAALLNEMCKRDNVDTENIRVMNLSFGVDVSDDELEKCDDSIKENRFIFTVRKTSDGATPFTNNEGGEELWKKFKEIMRYPNEADLSELAYTMRNTFNVIPLKDIVDMGGFNPLCNGEAHSFSSTQPSPFFRHMDSPRDSKVVIRGMEDTEFFMRLFLKALGSGDIETMESFRKAMTNPIFYRDEDWEKLPELKKIRKIGNEMTALSLIISGLASKESLPTGRDGERRTLGLTKGFYVPKVMQDFNLRK